MRHDASWKSSGVELAESHRLLNLAELDANTSDRERQFADVRAAWNPQGLIFNVTVTGKSQPLWCRDERLEDSDGLQVWIDTRATLNIHRASRYCHRYAFLPAGGGRRQHRTGGRSTANQPRPRKRATDSPARTCRLPQKITKTGYCAFRIRAGRRPRRLRSAAASGAWLYVLYLRSRARPANIRHGRRVPVSRRSHLLGNAGTRGRINAV